MRYTLVGGLFWVVSFCTGAAWGQAAPPMPVEKPLSAYDLPNNFYGAHLLVGSGTGRGQKHLKWARYLVGRWGYAKTLLGNIDRGMPGPQRDWVDYVNKCYALELIPVLRLGGRWENGQWIKPTADRSGDYGGIAESIKRVVQGLPRCDLCPLYIELWNEPNLPLEWSGKASKEEYAAFFVQSAKAIRSIDDKRIRILNGGLATSPEWAEGLCRAQTDFIKLWDFWACHPYPGNRPPAFNIHEKKAPANSDLTIDSYLREMDVIRKMGRDNFKVFITETGYDLGNAVHSRGEGHPIIDEYNRADYMMRAFRDYYPKWPEVAAVFPFEFCSEGWERFDWVYPDSDIKPDGSPTKPHYQYLAVAALAKPTDTTGSVTGTITVKDVGTRLQGVDVTLGSVRFESDPMGNYFFGRLQPGRHNIRMTKPGFRTVNETLEVTAAGNKVFDVELVATQKADLAGLVRSGDTGDALRGVTIKLSPGDYSVQTEGNGRYRIAGVIPARYTLTATAKGRVTYEAKDIFIAAGKDNHRDFWLGEQRAPKGENLADNAGIEAGGGAAASPGWRWASKPPCRSLTRKA